MFIHFKSDTTVTLPGFEAEITFEEKGKLFLMRWMEYSGIQKD